MKVSDEKKLAAYFDNELGKRSAKKVKQALQGNVEMAEQLARMERIGELVGLMNEHHLKGVSFDGFDKRVMNAIEAHPVSLGVAARLGCWWREFLAHRKSLWVPAVSVLGTAAAALLFVVTTRPSQTIPGMPNTATNAIYHASAVRQKSSVLKVANRANVNASEYTIVTENGERIGVVWIDE